MCRFLGVLGVWKFTAWYPSCPGYPRCVKVPWCPVWCILLSHTSDDPLILSGVKGSSTETEAGLELHKCTAAVLMRLLNFLDKE